jgi:hypothetical protein
MSAPFWKQLSTAALLGTARTPALPPLPQGLQDLALEEGAAPEARLLRTAAVAGLAQIAGLQPGSTDEPLPEPAMPSPPGVCRDPQAVSLLAQIAAEGPEALLAEACQLLAAAGQSLPHRLLPTYFDAAYRASALRDPVMKAAGTRGAWLSAKNREWRFAATAGIDEIDIRQWEEGDVATRTRYLHTLRKTEADQARELLEKTLPQESARDRVTLLGALRTQPGPSDEALLQGLLTSDRSKEVRTLAARLLSALPQSAFAQRMQARLQPCITTEKKLFRTHWVATPPQAFPADAAQDGIEEKPPGGIRVGERAWWLRQIAARTPLGWWTAHTSMTPMELVLWAAKTEWKEALLQGLAEAVTLQDTDPAWIHAIINAEVLPAQEAAELIGGLDGKEQREAWLKLAGSAPAFTWWLRLVIKAPITWDTAFWLAVEKKLIAHLHSDAAQYDYELRNLLPELACRIPMTATLNPTPWPTGAKHWPSFEDAAHRFQQTLERRSRLRQMLNIKL